MAAWTDLSPSDVSRDLAAGMVVSLVALPLCLGVALASNAPLLSGLVAGIVGGILVGILSGSQASVSGPAAGLTAVVASQIAALGSFQAFLLAVMIAGLVQIALGLARAGSLAAFFPSSVIKGLMAAIGVILILKQIPHVLGHDPDPEGDMAFLQPDDANTFSEFGRLLRDIQPGAALVGLASIAMLVAWERWRPSKRSNIPAPLFVVVLGVAISLALRRIGGRWAIEPSHLVQVPVADSFAGLLGLMPSPDFSRWADPKLYMAGVTIAAVASLETLLNLEAIDKLDPLRRTSNPSRELLSQGIGNTVAGLIGGLPITSVIVRSSVNIHAGGKTKLATIAHGALLLVSVVLLPAWLNMIPLSCLAAILLVTGVKLASPALVKRMWDEGRYQFVPFALTVVSIVLTDLLIGVLIGMAVSIGFILWSNVRRPLRRVVEKHLGGEVIHIELANQVSFLNRAALGRVLDQIPSRWPRPAGCAQHRLYRPGPPQLDPRLQGSYGAGTRRGGQPARLPSPIQPLGRDPVRGLFHARTPGHIDPAAGAATAQGRPRALPHRPSPDPRLQPPAEHDGPRSTPAGRRGQLHRLSHARRVDLRPGDGRHLQRPDRRERREPEGAGQRGIWVQRGRGEADPGHGAHPVRGRDRGRRPRLLLRDRRRGHGLSASRARRP